jgi:hypothetical protein
VKEYCVLKKNNDLRQLEFFIKLYSKCNNKDSLQEINLQHVVNIAKSEAAKGEIKDHWQNIEQKVGYSVFALCNSLSDVKGSLPKGYSFIVKLQPELAREISWSMYESTGVELEIMNIEI